MANDFNFKELEGLSKKEREYAISILKEISKDGNSKKYDNLIYGDYSEIPVTIEEFLHRPQYLGRALLSDDGKFTVFPYWEEVLKKMFPTNIDTAYNTAIFSGAIGLGKSTIAVIAILYQLYRMMCLKNPYAHYGLQEIDLITFAFINITIDAAKGVAWDKCQQMLQRSDWFMARGTLTKSANPIWQPPKGIELIVGSMPRHIIGRAVFSCLDGDTKILTNFGDKTLKELVGKSIKVASINQCGEIEYSNACTVVPTKTSYDEYEIVLEDNTIIKCTPEHKLLLTNGQYKEAKDLTENDDIFYANPEKSEYATYIDNIISSRGRFINNKNLYKERHHIIPKCCGGSNEEYNLIDLFPEEHYVAHYLLAKENPDNYKMAFALNCMLTLNNNHSYIINAKTYASARKIASEVLRKATSGKNNGMFGKSPWNKNKTKETDDRIKKYAETCSKTKIGIKKGPDSIETRLRKSAATKLRYKLKPETFVSGNRGKIAITDGEKTFFINKDDPLPQKFTYGNSCTRGSHNMENYYNNEEMQKRRKELNSGKNNPNYGHGDRQRGGKNGKAIYDYWFNGQYFECRKYLLEYLNSIGINISPNALRKIQNKTFGKCILKKFSYVIENLTWRLKNEN